jgi:CRP-like cAMP-binding protein
VALSQGAEAELVLLVLSGELRMIRIVRKPPQPSRVLELQRLRSGEICGDDAALTGQPLSYGTVAAVSSIVLTIDAATFVRGVCARCARCQSWC